MNEQLNDDLKALSRTMDYVHTPKERSVICELPDGGSLQKVAEYNLNAKKALIAYIMQKLHNNYNTWVYPEHIEGMRESKSKPGNWYYDYGNKVICSYSY